MAKMIKVLLCGERLDEHVVDVHFHGLAEIFGEHLVNEPLVRGTSVLEPEGHDFVAKDAPLRETLVKLQEVYETLAHVRAQECTDLHLVIFEARVDGDLIKTLHGRPVRIRMACRSRL